MVAPGRKKGEPFMVSNWEPSPGKCTAVMCSDSCDISSCAEVSEMPGNWAKMLLHLIWLGLFVDPWSALTKGVLQLKHSKSKLHCITNTRVCTSKQITQFAQGLTYYPHRGLSLQTATLNPLTSVHHQCRLSAKGLLEHEQFAVASLACQKRKDSSLITTVNAAFWEAFNLHHLFIF